MTDRITKDEAHNIGPCLTHSIGYEVCRNTKGIVIATDNYPDEPNTFCDWHFIPNEMVVEIKELTPQSKA